MYVTDIALAIDVDGLFEQQEMVFKQLREKVVPHSAEFRECIELLHHIQCELDYKLSSVTPEPASFVQRLQAWAESKCANKSELQRFQQQRARMPVVERFHTMHREIPRWNALSPIKRLVLFRSACGVPWLQANSKDFNDYQRITKGAGKYVKRKKCEWQKYISGAAVDLMPSVCEDELIQLGFPAAVPKTTAPTAALVPAAVLEAGEFMQLMRQRPETEDNERADELIAENITAPQPPPPRPRAGAKLKRLNYAVDDSKEKMQAARKDMQLIEVRIKKPLRYTAVRNVARKHGVGVDSLWDRYRGRIEWGAHVGPDQWIEPELEQELVAYIVEMADCGFGFNWNGVQGLARELGDELFLPNFKAGGSWLRGFRKRYPELARRRAQYFDRNKAGAMNPKLI